MLKLKVSRKWTNVPGELNDLSELYNAKIVCVIDSDILGFGQDSRFECSLIHFSSHQNYSDWLNRDDSLILLPYRALKLGFELSLSIFEFRNLRFQKLKFTFFNKPFGYYEVSINRIIAQPPLEYPQV